MDYQLPNDRMPEAEVSLRLAFHVIGLQRKHSPVRVAIDGAQVKIGRSQIFPIMQFLECHGWEQVGQKGKNPWQGWYERGRHRLRIRSRSGVGTSWRRSANDGYVPNARVAH